ncbi:MAG: tRNA uridine(34) 5-carboxymethylaminomethyl modification radical SAM/GNAT enzyme Elp3 [Candidatus Woesearchaeota archaeon]
MQHFNQYCDALYKELMAHPLSKSQIAKLKKELCIQFQLPNIPKDLEVLMTYSSKQYQQVKHLLMTKPVRSLSGVAPVAIMTEPRWCPHGRCTYCPGGVGSAFGDVPQSYTGKEPSTMRAIRNHYHGYFQVFNRLEYYMLGGHMPNKVELIIQGGTFPSYEITYQEQFVKQALSAMNDFGRLFFPQGEFSLELFKEFFELPGNRSDKQRTERIQQKMQALWLVAEQKTLQEIQDENERTIIRCVGMTLETRPDRRLPAQADTMLRLGATRIELGIQSVYDDVLQKVHRDHDATESKHSIALLKDMGFKINTHMMPGLPLTDYQRDIESLRTLFDDPAYRPDMLKIYPCMVMKGTALYNDWKAGRFSPITTQDATKIIGEMFRFVPRYCRVMRIQRDIPTNVTEAGVAKTNLRQYVDEYMQQHGIVSQDIRAREIQNGNIGQVHYDVETYEASGGKEFFFSVNSQDDKLIGFCRMRYPAQCVRSEITPTSALIRELHVNGTALALGGQGNAQHKGFGKALLALAEKQALKDGKDKMVIISGIGVREYYKKLGYHLEGCYMVKMLKK